MWQIYFQPRSISEAVELLSQYGVDARIVNGGTDLIFDLERRLRTPRVLIDVSRIPGLDTIREDGDYIRMGASVTLDQAIASQLLRNDAYLLPSACWAMGVPQVRTRATIAGNLITASPSNDCIASLWALGAEVKLKSVRGERTVPFAEFFKDVRQISMEPDEMLVEISCSRMTYKDRGAYVRLGWNREVDKALPNVGVVLEFEDDEISNAWINIGGVASTVVNAIEAEQSLVGQWLNDGTIDEAAELSLNAVQWGGGRGKLVPEMVAHALRQIRDNTFELPPVPAIMWGDSGHLHLREPVVGLYRTATGDVIEANINGENYTAVAEGKTLLQMLRDDLHLLNIPKCSDGVCGKCMVLLDGIAAMSCLVPAPRAHRAQVVVGS